MGRGKQVMELVLDELGLPILRPAHLPTARSITGWRNAWLRARPAASWEPRACRASAWAISPRGPLTRCFGATRSQADRLNTYVRLLASLVPAGPRSQGPGLSCGNQASAFSAVFYGPWGDFADLCLTRRRRL